jgi:Holliday junction resolvase
MTPEAKVKKKVRELLDKYDAYYFFPPANGYGRAGIPDIIACLRGEFIAIEVKAGNNKPTALQLRELQLVKDAGGFAMVCYEENLPELETFLKRLTGA